MKAMDMMRNNNVNLFNYNTFSPHVSNPSRTIRSQRRGVSAWNPTTDRNKIEFGDHIFARITKNGQLLYECTLDSVADMTQLLGEIRHNTPGMKGLTKLYIRNHSKGWSQERPLMLYPANDIYAAPKESVTFRRNPHMLFPWETH